MESKRKIGKGKVLFIMVDEPELRNHIVEVVRQNVEETLNALFEKWR